MMIEEAIKRCYKTIENYEFQIEAEEGLPGLYYDGERVKRLRKEIENCRQLATWLEELKMYRKMIPSAS